MNAYESGRQGEPVTFVRDALVGVTRSVRLSEL